MCLKCGCQGVVNLNQREYLKIISLHPFKDKVIHNSGYDFYITVSEPAPQVIDLIFYVENPFFKRPVHSVKEILLYPDGSSTPQRFTLDTDIAGVSSLRYRYQEPFEAKLKIITVASDRQNLSAETTVQIGSPKPSYFFLITFVITILLAVAFVSLKRGRRS
ncbi:MAG: hypothetical protein HZA49_06595 [Planctomycetes bacterium]|nr:hypothetical protein [Planctomycetota bacterium]